MAEKKKSSLLGKLFKVALVLVVLVAVLVIAAVGYALTLDSQRLFKRSQVISTDEATLYHYVGDLKQWAEWGPWNDDDPDMTYMYSESTTGAGAWMEWKSKQGDGRLEITSADEATGIEYLFTWEQQDPQKGALRYTPVEDGMDVAWSMDMDVGGSIPGRLMMKLMAGTMEDMFDKGLTNIKQLAEAEST